MAPINLSLFTAGKKQLLSISYVTWGRVAGKILAMLQVQSYFQLLGDASGHAIHNAVNTK